MDLLCVLIRVLVLRLLSLLLFLNLFFVLDVVLCPASVFCVIVLVFCFLVSFIEYVSLFWMFFVFVVLCICSFFKFRVCVLRYLSLILSWGLLIASVWPSRKTSPIPPMNQSSLEMVVHCVCSLFFNLFFVFDVVLCFCRWCRAICSCPLSLALVSFLLFVLCPWAVFGFGNQIESKEQEQRNKSNNIYNEQNHSQPIKTPHHL